MRHAPGWKRLWWHSIRVGSRWLARDARSGWAAGRTGFARLLVPLDPWRYYELGRAADEPFYGRCLDVSSPKLLPSLLQAEGSGVWVCIDLFEDEIRAWRRVDPGLDLAVADATDLPFPDDSFDCCACVSVLEHVGKGRDAKVLSEIWRVLAPGGFLVLTTDVAAAACDVFVDAPIYGDASPESVDGVFFKHNYAHAELDALIEALPWTRETHEYAVQRRPGVERRFYAFAPWSYAVGPFLRVVCPGNFRISASPKLIEEAGSGVAYLRLRKPEKSG